MSTTKPRPLTLDEMREMLTKNHEIFEVLQKTFDRSFSAKVAELNGQLTVTFKQQDSGQEYMTVGDVAAFLQMDKHTVRVMTEARAQQSTINPLPFIRIGKSLRFKRSDIIAWIERKRDESAITPLPKGKIKRHR